jgi:DUF1680 family protein
LLDGSGAGAAGASSRPVVALGERTTAVLRPLPAGGVVLAPSGFWASRVAVNLEASISAGFEQLEASGVLENLRLAAGTSDGPYRGKLPFLDTDVFKWLEAVSWHLQTSASPGLLARADEVIALVAAAQEPDGYLNSYVTVVRKGERWADLPSGHELYCAGHLIQAGVAHHRATGLTSLFDVARRFADLLVEEFGEGGRRVGYCGHPEVETALVELYRETGERAYLDFAARFVDLRGSGLLGDRPFGRRYFQDLLPVRETRAMHGHAVRALYLAAGVADLYLETGEAALIEVLRAQWDDLLRGKMYVTGGTGSRHRDEALGDAFELPADRAYTETCAAIAVMQWAWRMQLATGDAVYADIFERVLYNGFLAGTSLDGEHFFYVNPLQVRPDSTLGPHGRQRWFSCACCPPNVMRTMASLTHYLASVDADGLQIHQYASGSIRADVPARMGVDVSTGYPFDGDGLVRLEIPEECAGEWTLSLRIPAWARRDARVHVDGAPVEVGGVDYLRIRRVWGGGEVIELELPMRPRLTLADRRVDDARGCVAIERGPLVYCAEQLDQHADLDRITLRGSARDAGSVAIAGLSVPTVAVEATVETTAEAAVEAAHADEGAGASSWPYRELGDESSAAARGERTTLTAIPYFAWANREYGAMRVWLPHEDAH